MHRFDGILVARGPRIRRGALATEAGIIDIAPTLLRLCGLGTPSHMDGRALTELLTDDVPEPEQAVGESVLSRAATESPYSEDEAREVEARLRDLGYL